MIEQSYNGSIINADTVSSDTPDPDPCNNAAVNTADIASLADIVVTKSDQPTIANLEKLLAYTITVRNQGPDTAENVILYDQVPPELTNSQFSTDFGATWSVFTNPYLLSTIPSGQN